MFDASQRKSNPSLELVLEELLWGLCNNGLLASPGKEAGIKELYVRLANLSPGRFQHVERVKALLHLLSDRKRIIRHARSKGTPLDTDQAWLDLMVQLHASVPFKGIICGQHEAQSSQGASTAFIDVEQVLGSNIWRNRKNTHIITQNENDYRRILTPLLRYAKSLDLVDPYFSPTDDKYIRMLKLCMELLGRKPSSSPNEPFNYLESEITIHSYNPEKSKEPDAVRLIDRTNSWKTLLPTLGNRPNLKRISVIIWQARQDVYTSTTDDGPRMHDRYILTDQCGVQVPSGLDCPGGKMAKSTDWCLLDWEDYNERRKQYPPDATKESSGLPFQFVARYDYVPT